MSEEFELLPCGGDNLYRCPLQPALAPSSAYFNRIGRKRACCSISIDEPQTAIGVNTGDSSRSPATSAGRSKSGRLVVTQSETGQTAPGNHRRHTPMIRRCRRCMPAIHFSVSVARKTM